MKTFYTLILVFTISFSVVAQEKIPSTNIYSTGGKGYFSIGIGQFDFNGLNTELDKNGYPGIENGFISMGGGGHFQMKRFIIGGEGHGFMANSIENKNYSTYGTGGYGFFNLGLALYQKNKFSSYFLLGLGGGGYSIDISENGDVDLKDIMNGSFKQIHLTESSLLIKFSLGTDFFVLGDSSDKAISGVFVGLRAGYTLDLANSWSTENQLVNNVPPTHMSGPFIKLIIGGGGYKK